MKFTIILTFVLLLMPGLLFAATGKVKGVVIDKESKQPLIGASVALVGTTMGAVSDADGHYVVVGVPAGTYTVKSTFVGYQTVSIQGVIVNSDLTSEVNFSLSTEALELKPVEIIAERPLVNKNATNAVRISSADDIQALPVRGINNIIALTPGVVLQDNTVFIRGGRQDEVGFYLDGVNITNPMVGGRAVTLVQDAIQEIQVQAGGFNAEFGGANAGIVQQQLKTGTSNFKGSAQFYSDNLGFRNRDNAYGAGKNWLGAQQYGYDEFTGTLSGPLMDERFKFFGLFNYLFQRDPNPQPYPGINLGIVSGYPATKDTINLQFPAGALPGSSVNQFTYTGTLSMDFHPITLRLGGTYTANTSFTPFSAARVTGNIANFMNTSRNEQIDAKNASVNLKMTHLVSPTTFYEVTLGYFRQQSNTFDPILGDNFLGYGDSVANAQAGYVWSRRLPDPNDPGDKGDPTGRYVRPAHKSISIFSFNAPGDVIADYVKFRRENLSISGGLSSQIGTQHSIKVGGDYSRYSIRNYSFGNEGVFALPGLIAANNTLADNDPQKLTLEQIYINRGVNNFGYDVFGNETSGSGGILDAKHPVFASAYVQDKIEYSDLVMNIGFRYDYINTDSKKFIDPTFPDLSINKQTGVLNPAGFVDVPSFDFISPRIGLSFPVTDRTVFHAQFGKFVQQSRLRDIYQGLYATGSNIRGGFFIGAPVGFDIRPERTTQYEFGFNQQISDFASFDITGYYKDIVDQIVYDQVNLRPGSAFGAYAILRNGDFATTKGVELTLNMRRQKRVQINASVSFQDAQGTGSFPNSNRGIVSAPLDGVTIEPPKYVTPLEYNNAIRGSVNLDYHFGRNDGPSILEQFGGSALVTFNSGHPFTRGIGGADLEGDARDRIPIEPLNSSTTPWIFQVDLRLDKTFSLMDRLGATVYLSVINLLDAQNVQNVFLRTGTTNDDGYLRTQNYSSSYEALYRAINLDYYEQYQNAPSLATVPFFFGPPRQIRLGFRLDY
jgi:hypothetical protein